MMKPDKTNKLSNEELEQVSGGCVYETANDSKFLNVLLRDTGYYRCDRYGRATVVWGSSGISPLADVENAWKGLGIKIEFHDRANNKYYLDGKQITRDEAWDHAEKLVGKHLERSDWNW